jgi:hypothetical protein
MRRAGDGDLQKNGTSPSKQAVFDGGRSFCGTSPSLVAVGLRHPCAVGLRHSCGHLSHLRDASDIRVRSASDIRAVIPVIYGTTPTSVCGRPPTFVRSSQSFTGRLRHPYAVGLRHSCGHPSHLRDASNIRVRSASDICAVGLRHPCGTSLSFAGHLRHLWRLRPLPPGHLFIGLTAGTALFRFLTGIFRFFRFLNM